MINIASDRSRSLACGFACLLLAHVADAQTCPRQWVQLNLPVSPSPRLEGFFGGDQLIQRGTAGVLFGGVGPSGRLNDTWFWHAATTSNPLPRWELVQTTRTPFPTSNGGVATDAAGGSAELHIYGGLVGSGPAVLPAAGWYTFDPSTRVWQLRSGLAGARWNNALAFGTGNLVTFGGAPDLASASPLLGSAVRVIDAATLPAVGQGGFYALSGAQFEANTTVFPFGDRRATVGSAFTEVAGVSKLAFENGVYAWQQLSWPMPPRCNYALTSRRVSGQSFYEVVLFGGDRGTFPASTTLLGDTWILNPSTGAFSQVQGPGPSPRRARNQLIYDRSRDWYVLFGGHNGEYLNDTWVLSKTPVLRSQSLSRTHCAGQPLTLSVDVGWNDPILYQWFENGNAISASLNPSAATSTLVVPNFSAGTSTVFEFRITTACDPTGRFGDAIVITPAPASTCAACDSIDFNQDTLFPDDADLIDFLSVLAGGPCSAGNTCNDIDFNNDGLFPDDNDLVAFLRVLAGGAC